jgi:hypothetical protein
MSLSSVCSKLAQEQELSFCSKNKKEEWQGFLGGSKELVRTKQAQAARWSIYAGERQENEEALLLQASSKKFFY